MASKPQIPQIRSLKKKPVRPAAPPSPTGADNNTDSTPKTAKPSHGAAATKPEKIGTDSAASEAWREPAPEWQHSAHRPTQKITPNHNDVEVSDNDADDDTEQHHFQAIGTLYGTLSQNKDDVFFIQLGRNHYRLFVPGYRRSGLTKQYENNPEPSLYFRVYPKILAIPKKALKENDMSLLYAMFLLAQFRETSAYPLIIEFISKSEKIVEDLLGDSVTEDLGRILASVCDGKVELIKKVIENPEAGEFVRSSALKSLIILVAQNQLSRDEVIDYFRELIDSKLPEEKSDIWTALAVESTYLCLREIEPEIKQVFDKDLIDPFMIRFEHFQADTQKNVNQSLAKLRKNPLYSPVNNTIAEMEWWACFEENQPKPILVNEEVAPTFAALRSQVNPSEKTQKKSKKKKKGFG